MLGPEPIADRLKEILLEGYEAAIDILRAEYDDGVDLPSIAAVHLESPDGDQFSYPCTVISEANWKMEGASQSMAECTYIFAVDQWDTATVDGLEAMHRRLWRYQRASIELLRLHTTTEKDVWIGLQLENRRPEPLRYSEKERAYYRGKGILVGVLVDEDY